MISKLKPLWRGLPATFLSLLVVGSLGYGLADDWRSSLDNFLGTESYVVDDSQEGYFTSNYDTAEEMMNAARNFAIKQGREGFVLMKNDNNALPLSKDKEVALFGAAAWAPYMQSTGDLKAGNDDAVNLDDALTNAGYTLNEQMRDIYDNILADYTVSSRFGNTTITYDNGYQTSPGDMTNYQVREVPPDRYTDTSLRSADADPWVEIPDDWQAQMRADKEDRVGIVVFARGVGESNTYKPGAGTTNFDEETTDKDPLELSDDELAIIDAAKDTCSQVIVLLNTGNAMMIDDIAEGGSHEVDAIGYMGVINDYQCTGIVQVLSGEYNATGALSDTYAVDHMSAPALMNFGGNEYAGLSVVDAQPGDDPRYPTQAISSGASSSSGFGGSSYNASEYIVEAEGIYVGYQYYETRYYDSIADDKLAKNATSAKGSTTGEAWNYDDEIVYTFGHSLSYLDYDQEITAIEVDNTNEGNITATVKITNKSDKDGYFLAQLYVSQPYTEYDVENKVEKSAIMFLNSGKIEVAANSSAEIKITVPAKYLASYDYTNAKTYILDEGDYYFTAAAGAHEAVNNILAEQGYTSADGVDAAANGAVLTWNKGSFDSETYSTDNGVEITNVADNADLNYWLPGTVTYLSRSDWDATWPINYNTGEETVDYNDEDATINQDIDITKSEKEEEWVVELRGYQYLITDRGEEAENVDGVDNGVRFNTENINVDIRSDINDPFWETLVSQISVNEAIGAIVHGGGATDELTYLENPSISQHEGVNGVVGAIPDTEYKLNVNSQSLMGTSFNPDLAYEWGILQGDIGIWTQSYTVWGTGLTLRRTPYNGRNYEYISEDPMLTNRIGYGILKGTAEMGLVCGPKHIGFNDQEHNRSGVSVYMNEQKFRQTDLRGFEGGLNEGGGLAVMVAFNRIGATNASHHVGMLKNILRGEWGFTGIISTDLASAPYFDAASMIMATVTERAEFGSNNSYISETSDYNEADADYSYLTINSVKNDPVLVEQSRENLKYQFYTFANTVALNVVTIRVMPWWETALISVIVVSAVVGAAATGLWITSNFLKNKKEEEN